MWLRKISKQILRGSGGGCTGTANPLTAQYIQTHLANTPEPHSPNILCTNENLAGFTPPSLEWSPVPTLGSLSPISSFLDMDFNDWYDRYVEAPAPPSPLRLPLQETQPALAPAPPSPPPPAPSSPTLPAQIRAVAPPPPHVMLAPGLSVSQDASPVMGYLMVRAVLPQEKGDRVRVAYIELVWSVTRTLPPAAQQHRPAQPALPVEGPGRLPAAHGREGAAGRGQERPGGSPSSAYTSLLTVLPGFGCL
ncbi:g11412 [Coccomyxa elongata]